MTQRTPLILLNGVHTPMPAGDSLGSDAIAISTDAGNSLKAGSDKGLFVPQSTPTIPYAAWEIGHSAQPNNGKGIDETTFYRLDMSIGRRGMIPGMSIDADGYLVLPAGVYQVLSDAVLMTTAATGEYKATFFDASYAMPGIYQYAVRSFLKLDGTSGRKTISMSGVPLGFPTRATYAYDKGSDNSAIVQGFVSVLKIG